MEELRKSSLNTHEEIQKLQDLVRKLELQNQKLRSKNVSINNLSSNEVTNLNTRTNVNLSNSNVGSNNESSNNEENHIGENNNCSFKNEIESNDVAESFNYMDEIDIIKVNDVDMSDDESWLYKSPIGLTPEQKNESPYKWLRRDVDDLENKELQFAKKALITKLNELEILSSTSQVNSPSPINRTVNQLRKPIIPPHVPFSSPDRVQYSSIDTRTFTKSKKKQALEYLSSTVPIITNCYDLERKEAQLCRRGSDISLDSNTGTYTLTDASDVQEVARMQEESLRLSSPITTPKRQSVASTTSSRRMSVSSRSSVSDLESFVQPSSTSPHISLENDPSVNTAFNSLTGKNSDHSSPSESPYGSNASLDSVGQRKGELYRSSLPNLNRNPIVSKSRKSVPSRESRQQKSFATKSGASGRKSDSNLLVVNKPRTMISPSRHVKQPNRPVPSTSSGVNIPQNHEFSSKTIKVTRSAARLTVKSGLPRPSRATSATRIGSGIPVPSTITRKNAEDSWSDGCF